LSGDYKKKFQEVNPDLQMEHVLFNSVASLPAMDKRKIKSFNLIYIQLPIRSMLGDKMVDATNFNDENFLKDTIDHALEMLENMLDAALYYTQKYGILTLVSNFIVPQMRIVSNINDYFSSGDLAQTIDLLNRTLYDLVKKKYSNTYVMDVDAVANSLGKQYFLDDIIFMYSHGATYYANWQIHEGHRVEPVPSLAETYNAQEEVFFLTVYRQMESFYRTFIQIDQVKLVIFDLDNTLWRGEIGEHYNPGMSSPPVDGWPLGMWEAVHHLRWRGILVAICSKNSYELVVERWNSAVPFPWLSLDNFVIKKINWDDKITNIQEFLANLNCEITMLKVRFLLMIIQYKEI
jgi:predicted enzyme involved in methoxymalonyl-ACP biosynthesis